MGKPGYQVVMQACDHCGQNGLVVRFWTLRTAMHICEECHRDIGVVFRKTKRDHANAVKNLGLDNP